MSVFPGAIDSPDVSMQGTTLFTSDSHSLQHRTLGSAVIGIENFLGTNAASNVFTGFNFGDHAAKRNFDTLGTPTINSPQINNGTIGTALILGGTANNQTLGTPSLNAPTITGRGTNSGTIINGVYNTPTLQIWNFWVQANETPIVLGTLSAQGVNIGTLQVTATASNKYDKGDKLQFTQGGSTLYAYIYSIPSGTTILATGGTDYVIGTGAITNLLYSKASNPNGFPDWFNFTPNITFTGTAPTGLVASLSQFKIDSHEVRYRFHVTYGTAGTTNGIYINQPIPSNITGNIFHDPGMGLLSTGAYTSAPNVTPQETTLAGGTTIQQQYPNTVTETVWMQGNYAI